MTPLEKFLHCPGSTRKYPNPAPKRMTVPRLLPMHLRGLSEEDLQRALYARELRRRASSESKDRRAVEQRLEFERSLAAPDVSDRCPHCGGALDG